jgi:hypothetical protein
MKWQAAKNIPKNALGRSTVLSSQISNDSYSISITFIGASLLKSQRSSSAHSTGIANKGILEW